MRRLIVLLVLAFTLVLVPAVSAQPMKPLRGEMELFFTGPANPLWTGTISGDINGDMYFYATGSKDVGQVHHFWEVWNITTVGGDLIGTDKGVVSWKNGKYRMNGIVTEATGNWAYLEGHRVHMSGYITFDPDTGLPATAPGTFQVN